MKTYSTHTKHTQNAPKRLEAAFTLIEVMLVVVIIGIMAAVIVPRAWRANIDTKYATLRQTCAQLAGYANDWAVRQLETQNATLNLNDFLNSLTEGTAGTNTYIAATGSTNNWANSPKTIGTVTPTSVVQDLVPEAPPLRNPFNGLEVFQSGNNGVTPGAIGCAFDTDSSSGAPNFNYYALIFQGSSDWYAGQGTNLAGLRNGIFIARVRP